MAARRDCSLEPTSRRGAGADNLKRRRQHFPIMGSRLRAAQPRMCARVEHRAVERVKAVSAGVAQTLQLGFAAAAAACIELNCMHRRLGGASCLSCSAAAQNWASLVWRYLSGVPPASFSLALVQRSKVVVRVALHLHVAALLARPTPTGPAPAGQSNSPQRGDKCRKAAFACCTAAFLRARVACLSVHLKHRVRDISSTPNSNTTPSQSPGSRPATLIHPRVVV